MNTDDYDSFVNVPCVLFEGKHNDSYLAAYLGCDQSSYGYFSLHFCINGKRKAVDMSQDDFYEFTGLTDEDCPDSIGCCDIIDDIIKSDLAEYVIDWELIDLENQIICKKERMF